MGNKLHLQLQPQLFAHLTCSQIGSIGPTTLLPFDPDLLKDFELSFSLQWKLFQLIAFSLLQLFKMASLTTAANKYYDKK